MKTIILVILLISVNLFAFGGGHDSLTFDGEVYIKPPQKSDCTIRILGWNNLKVTSYKIVQSTSCGEVFTEKKEEKHFVEEEMDVPPGSEISTAVSGHALIQLDDGSTILLREKTKIVIDENFCHKNKLIKLFTGSIWQNIKKIVSGSSYEVSVGRYVAGVRGTQFEVTEEDGKSEVKVYEGTVEVTPIMNDNANQMVIKEYEKIINDMETGIITPDEYSEKIIRISEIMEGSRQFPSVMVYEGNMVNITFEVSSPMTIPAENNKWFEDPKYFKK